MSVKAKITMNDGTTISKLVNDWDELMLWLMKHHGEYTGFEAHDLNNGREQE